MTDYIFNGDRIKINIRDWDKLKRLYPNLDLMAEVEQLDIELRDEKKWWMVMNAKLNYRNKNHKPVTTKSRSMREDLTDRSWADNVLKLER